MFNNNINQFFNKKDHSQRTENKGKKETPLKKGLKETWRRCGLWLGAGQAEAMGSEDACITELPSVERGIL